ncbi:MAG: hypothetical protein JO239_01050 [Paraburkholderia sp.]|nr:hypothetical protein [Paraburkholderia sp.]
MNEGSWRQRREQLRADQIGGYRQKRDNSVDECIDKSGTDENTNDSDSNDDGRNAGLQPDCPAARGVSNCGTCATRTAIPACDTSENRHQTARRSPRGASRC